MAGRVYTGRIILEDRFPLGGRFPLGPVKCTIEVEDKDGILRAYSIMGDMEACELRPRTPCSCGETASLAGFDQDA